LILLAVGVSLSVVLAAIWVASGRGTDRSEGPGGTRLPRGTPPNVAFAAGVTSGDQQVDAFVANFIGLCRRGDYDQYRLHWTAYGTPVSGERFQSMWKFARNVVISEITPVPQTAKAMHRAYLIKGHVELDPTAKVTGKDVELMVQWEDNRWAVAPAPRVEPAPEALPFTDTSPTSQPEAAPVQQG
jgi:hypothetical protein